MKVYSGSDIRNVAVVGHSHSGKTTLISALLHAAKMTPAQGRVEDGSAVTAYDEEEVARRTTMANALAFAEWKGVKINLLDTPGFHMFVHEARAAMLPVEAALVVVNAQIGAEAVTDRVWKYAAEVELPRILVINQIDHPKADSRIGRQHMIELLAGEVGPPGRARAVAHRRSARLPWRRGPGDDEGVSLPARRRRPRQSRERFPRRFSRMQRPRTKRWSSWWPKARTS